MATILTDVGRAKLLVATPMSPVTLSYIAFGDGGGSAPTIVATATALVNELLQVEASNPLRDTADPTVIMVSGYIPRTFGGVTLRELGLFDDVGDLIAYGSLDDQIIPTPTDEYGFTYTAVMRVKLDNSDMTTVINSDAPSFDHRGLTFRDEPDAHPATAIVLTQTSRTVQSMIDEMKIIASSGILVVGERVLLTTNSTQTLPSTSGLTNGSKVVITKASEVLATITVENTGTEQIRLGNNSLDYADFDSVLFNYGKQLTFIWTGTVWECIR